MEARETTLSIPPKPRRQKLRPFSHHDRMLWGSRLVVISVALAAIFIKGFLLVQLLILALIGATALLMAYAWPGLLAAGMLGAALFNYGLELGGASIKLTEFAAAAMVAVIVMRLVAGDAQALVRFKRGAGMICLLGGLGLLAIITAIPHPNAFNVRYEIENYIAFTFMLLFFRRRWWPRLVLVVLAALAAEAAATLIIKFVFGLTGVSLFSAGRGMDVILFSSEDLENFAGGRFRLSGTFGHKNMLAAFFVLFLPLAGLDTLRQRKPWRLAVIVPALIALALTDSMTGWAAILVITVMVLIHLRRFDYLAFMALLVLPLAGLALYEFGESIFERIQQLASGQEGWNTVSSRFQIFEISKHLLTEYPWAGIGRGNFLSYGQTYYTHAHNLFLMKAIEMGIPGGVAFSLVILALVLRPWPAIARQAARLAAQRQYYRTLGLWLGCLGFLAMNFFDYNYAHFSLGPLFMGMLGILMSVSLDLETLSIQNASAKNLSTKNTKDTKKSSE